MVARIAAALAGACLLLFGGGAVAGEKDRYDPNVVSGDWIGPADILFIGDSEGLGYFGAQLYRAMAGEHDPRSGKALRVWSFWTCGSDAQSWLVGATSYCGIRTCNSAGSCARDHGPDDRPGRVHYSALRYYLGKVAPRITIVALGVNMLSLHDRAFHRSYDGYLEGVAALAGQVRAAGSRCIWIGPPQVALRTKSAEDYTRFSTDLGRAAKRAGCGYIDSNPLSDRRYVAPRDSEGIHYQPTGEKAWQANVWTVLRPILIGLLNS
ncbi:MAG: SGNH/GDSL hydrolase family protein [Alphaproteobacteria bacterium]|nr:SGNH/GDSL hydrolase family protein [Alphaproteobacteria bacterium]MBL7097672.1 SGNH/GDSL hydrolase family protein [Alphaproteobacteria bacterium]